MDIVECHNSYRGCRGTTTVSRKRTTSSSVALVDPLRTAFARRGGAGGLCAWRLDPVGRRSHQSDGHDRHLQEPGQLCEEINEKVKAFLSRPIEGDWRYLWVDATYVKARESGRIVSAAVIVAVGVNSDGRREVLGMDIGPSEAETFWIEFLRKLARRGLRGVKLVISDAHEGIQAAIGKVLHASWQRCPSALHAQRARLCRPPGPSRGRRLHWHRFRSGRRRGREQAMAPGRRSVAS